ncbi:MAG: helix-turn-helix domain-containing protein [Pseudoalteromonas distincta]|uniref:helix-turn-helix domain-containing protein n=1 Tax=Pseudoalteromonas distincta TaxID=77608 RepID=UPI003F98F27E
MLENVPETTSAQALKYYPAGDIIVSGEGPVWQSLSATIFSLNTTFEHFKMPVVAEPMMVWVISGEAETKERVDDSEQWQTEKIIAGTVFVTASGESYEFKWRRLSEEPVRILMVVLSLPVYEHALAHIFNEQADCAELNDFLGSDDSHLIHLLQCIKLELSSDIANDQFIFSIGSALATHIARKYCSVTTESKRSNASLQGYKLRKVISWMKQNLHHEFSLHLLAQLVELSDFHFNRLFKQAVGIPPSQYFISLKIQHARQLLRESDIPIIDVANEVGYVNPSHFARLFKKTTGLSPRAFRKQS